MKIDTYYPNRVYAAVATSSTGWQIVGLKNGGTGYADYATLVAAGDTPFPGSPTDFPLGLPKMLARSVASGGVSDGSPFALKTQGINTPSAEDDLISGSGQTYILEDDSIKAVWIKKSVAGDTVLLTGYF